LEAATIGKIAPDFSGPNPDGKIISLKENLGKVTIIDFWAAWCKPCRIENPNMVALYNDFKDKGLKIIGVSLDKEDAADAWKQAIEVDKLDWAHVSNLKHWKEPIALLYGVNEIPSIFILDEKGTILAINLRGDALRAKITELLGA
jgi:peroxiredoxin